MKHDGYTTIDRCWECHDCYPPGAITRGAGIVIHNPFDGDCFCVQIQRPVNPDTLDASCPLEDEKEEHALLVLR